MPAEVFGPGYQFLPKEEILRFSEIETIAKAFARVGVKKLRLTGGEPLLRRDLSVLVGKLAQIEGIEDIAMTTNAVLLARHALALREAGLKRLAVSLDALDETIFGEMNGVGASPKSVIEGIDAALDVGMGVKVNAVVKRGVNESEVISLVEFAESRGIPVRFIEYMDTGNANQWGLDDVVPSQVLRERITAQMELEPVSGSVVGETATRFKKAGGSPGFEVGFISSVSQPFCSACNRARLSAQGSVYHCLFASEGYDLKELLRSGVDEDQLCAEIARHWSVRGDRYSQLRTQQTGRKKIEMSYIGG